MTTEHPKTRQRKLQLAGLSMASELTDDQIKRIDAVPLKDAERLAGARLREQIQKGGVVKR